MQETLGLLYLWLKAGHIIFIVFWMAGLFILPRQMLYMHAAPPGSAEEALWAKRTRMLSKVILIPSIIVVWVLGLLLAQTIGAWDQGWFHGKLALVVLLSGYHGWMSANAKKMAKGARPLTERALRLWGEVPAVILALVVILVVVKPF
ncbi:CopD family protein [Erythrobacter sp. LQ02-29]|uniref:CopD family protein n=1 Tax=unclassified Erythrobacter TaxID=2633097 RepID=UPI001BFCA709|nr:MULTISPECIES: CopD family protein [unclassified Erythrobacter]MCP9221841.1 CopD family protein [Erythrobacter sp. LQ02-29]QWC56799.1 CopD family protein [Erythrobacter sp. 3-20A1M]|tara:strand:+ start:81 stop:524 length:444 start_codon:yes stop_codon:yes gene_type:complete